MLLTLRIKRVGPEPHQTHHSRKNQYQRRLLLVVHKAIPMMPSAIVTWISVGASTNHQDQVMYPKILAITKITVKILNNIAGSLNFTNPGNASEHLRAFDVVGVFMKL